MPMPQQRLLAGFDHKNLNQASAELRSWIPNLFALAARPNTYLKYAGFLIAATGKIPFAGLLAGAVDNIWISKVQVWLLSPPWAVDVFQYVLRFLPT